MKDKMNTFQEDEELRDLAIKRALGQMVIEGEKRDEYEKGEKNGILIGKKEGSYQERLSIVLELFQNLYPNELSNFLNDCTIEQLKHITTMLIQKQDIQSIYEYLKE